MDNNDGYFNRRACQRCHAQKLACRPETEDKCLRCIKAGAECIPRSPLRVRKSSNVTKHRGSYSHRNNSIGETSDNNVPTRSATKTSDLMESSERGHSSSSSSKSNNTRKNSSESRDSRLKFLFKLPTRQKNCINR